MSAEASADPTVRSSLEDIDTVTKRLKVAIPNDTVKREIATTLDQLATTSRVKGFREGKAPRHLVEKMHGTRVRMDVVRRLISSTLNTELERHKLEVIGYPEIETSSFEEGKDIEYTAHISIFPKPIISGYEKISVSVPKRGVSDEDVASVIERFRKSKATVRKLEFRNTVQAEDVIDASFEISGPGLDNSPAESATVGLGEGRLPEEVEKGLIGMGVGETREIKVKLPDDSPNEELRNKEIVYKIQINLISEKVLPDIDDAFAKSLEWSVETLLELRLKIRESLEKEFAAASKSDTEIAIIDQLLKANDFQIPQVLVDDELRNLLVRSRIIDPAKIHETSLDPFRKDYEETARRRVRSAIVIDRIAEQEGIKAAEEDLNATLQRVASENNVSVDDVKKFYYDKNRLVGFVLEVTRNKVLEFLTSKAVVSYSEKAETDAARK